LLNSQTLFNRLRNLVNPPNTLKSNDNYQNPIVVLRLDIVCVPGHLEGKSNAAALFALSLLYCLPIFGGPAIVCFGSYSADCHVDLPEAYCQLRDN